MPSRSRWQDGRRAWARLNGWHQLDPQNPLGHPDSGKRAILALGESHFVRSLLETAELNAVATARAHGHSWSEIATALHQSKQAAWEKWHDLDPEPTEP